MRRNSVIVVLLSLAVALVGCPDPEPEVVPVDEAGKAAQAVKDFFAALQDKDAEAALKHTTGTDALRDYAAERVKLLERKHTSLATEVQKTEIVENSGTVEVKLALTQGDKVTDGTVVVTVSKDGDDWRVSRVEDELDFLAGAADVELPDDPQQIVTTFLRFVMEGDRARAAKCWTPAEREVMEDLFRLFWGKKQGLAEARLEAAPTGSEVGVEAKFVVDGRTVTRLLKVKKTDQGWRIAGLQ